MLACVSWFSLERLFFRLHLHLHLSLNRGSCWDTAGDFTISFLYFSVFHCLLGLSELLWHVHSLMLTSLLFVCLPCLLPPFTVSCKMVLTRSDERETYPTLHDQFVPLCDGQVFVLSDCMLDLGTDFLTGNMLVREA